MTDEIKLKTFKKEDISYIKNLCKENNCELSLRWKNKFTDYLVFDYEPFRPENFEINAYIKSEDCNKAHFVEYLYNRRKDKINKLNTILNNEVKV